MMNLTQLLDSFHTRLDDTSRHGDTPAVDDVAAWLDELATARTASPDGDAPRPGVDGPPHVGEPRTELVPVPDDPRPPEPSEPLVPIVAEPAPPADPDDLPVTRTESDPRVSTDSGVVAFTGGPAIDPPVELPVPLPTPLPTPAPSDEPIDDGGAPVTEGGRVERQRQARGELTDPAIGRTTSVSERLRAARTALADSQPFVRERTAEVDATRLTDPTGLGDRRTTPTGVVIEAEPTTGQPSNTAPGREDHLLMQLRRALEALDGRSRPVEGDSTVRDSRPIVDSTTVPVATGRDGDGTRELTGRPALDPGATSADPATTPVPTRSRPVAPANVTELESAPRVTSTDGPAQPAKPTAERPEADADVRVVLRAGDRPQAAQPRSDLEPSGIIRLAGETPVTTERATPAERVPILEREAAPPVASTTAGPRLVVAPHDEAIPSRQRPVEQSAPRIPTASEVQVETAATTTDGADGPRTVAVAATRPSVVTTNDEERPTRRARVAAPAAVRSADVVPAEGQPTAAARTAAAESTVDRTRAAFEPFEQITPRAESPRAVPNGTSEAMAADDDAELDAMRADDLSAARTVNRTDAAGERILTAARAVATASPRPHGTPNTNVSSPEGASVVDHAAGTRLDHGAGRATGVERVPYSALAESIVARARTVPRDGSMEVRFALDPEDLGLVRVRIESRGDEVRIRIIAASSQAADTLGSGVARLSAQMQDAGFREAAVDLTYDDATGSGRQAHDNETSGEHNDGERAADSRTHVGRDSTSTDHRRAPGSSRLDRTA